MKKVFDKSEKDAKLNTRCRWSPERSGWSGDSAEKKFWKIFEKVFDKMKISAKLNIRCR